MTANLKQASYQKGNFSVLADVNTVYVPDSIRWKSATYYGAGRVMAIPLVADQKHGIYEKALFFHDSTGNQVGMIMKTVADSSYIASRNGKTLRAADFSGQVHYYTLKGQYVKGFNYSGGKVIETIRKTAYIPHGGQSNYGFFSVDGTRLLLKGFSKEAAKREIEINRPVTTFQNNLSLSRQMKSGGSLSLAQGGMPKVSTDQGDCNDDLKIPFIGIGGTGGGGTGGGPGAGSGSGGGGGGDGDYGGGGGAGTDVPADLGPGPDSGDGGGGGGTIIIIIIIIDDGGGESPPDDVPVFAASSAKLGSMLSVHSSNGLYATQTAVPILTTGDGDVPIGTPIDDPKNPAAIDPATLCYSQWEEIVDALAKAKYLDDGRKPIKPKDYTNCFSDGKVASGYKMTVYVKQPNPGRDDIFDMNTPNLLGGEKFNIKGQLLNVGHMFVGFEKDNIDGSSVTQVMGFYPAEGGLTPTQGAIKDDGGEAFNLSLTVEVSANQFNAALNQLKSDDSKPYHLSRAFADENGKPSPENNCVDEAVSWMNIAGANLPKTSSKWVYFDNSPGEYGMALAKAKGLSPSSNVRRAPDSKGPCN